MAGILQWLIERLYRWMRYWSPRGPRFLMWWMVSSSGPTVRELLLFLIACKTKSGEKRDTELSNGHSLWSLRLTIRADRSPVWETAEVNYLANAVAISTLQMRDLEEKMMGWLGGDSARFIIRNLIKLHRREGLHLCEHDSTVLVHFCLLELLMLRYICALSSWICYSEFAEPV